MEQPGDMAKKLGLDRQSRVVSRLRRWLLLGGMVVAAGLAALYWNSRQATGQPRYLTQEVRRGSLTVAVSATGTLQPTNQVDVGSEISGTIKSVEVDYNDRVKRGQVLARIDTSKLEAQLKQSLAALAAARARVQQAQATVSEAKAKLGRLRQVQQVSGGKVPSQSEMETAQATFERAVADAANSRATVTQGEATLEAQRTDLAKAVIRSPVDGVVLKRAAEPGQTVAASFQTPVLFTLAEDLTQMELHVDVDEADVGKVREGQGASFTVDAYPERTFPARLSQVRFGAKTVAGVVTYETVLKVDNAGLLLRPGMTGTASIVVEQARDVLLVPNAALRFVPPQETSAPASRGLVANLLPRPPRRSASPPGGNDKQPHVWVLQQGRLQKVTLKTGMSDGSLTEVKGGALAPGRAVVVDVIEVKKPS